MREHCLDEPPITSHPALLGSDLEAVREIAPRVYAPNTTAVLERSHHGRAVLKAAKVGRLTIGQVGYGAAVRMVPDPLSSCYHLNLPITGRTHSVCAQDSITSSPSLAAVFSPDQPMAINWSGDCLQIALKIERDWLQTELEAMLGREVTPVRFDLGFDLTTPAGRSWLRNLQYVRSELVQQGSAIHRPFAGNHYSRLLVSTLLLTHAHNHSEDLARPAAPARSRAVQKVVELIEQQPDVAYSAGDLAAHAGLSLRALQAGFHREFGVSPMTYLMTVRLSRVHADLVKADPDRVTTARLAYRWGFTHLGRFAKAYRARYGVAPSETLHRTG